MRLAIGDKIHAIKVHELFNVRRKTTYTTTRVGVFAGRAIYNFGRNGVIEFCFFSDVIEQCITDGSMFILSYEEDKKYL